MAYDKQIWTTGEIITADKLNHIEDGIANSGSGSDSSSSIPLESTTYAELLAKRNGGTLTPGMQYRITDYVCTTTQEESRAVSHPFDIIVIADNESTLNENARACLHEGDDYYSAEGHQTKLEAWELKYCIDNDTDRFAWADASNGKGVIFYMKDEHGNECPYDFKQIQFMRYKITASSVDNLIGQYTLTHGSAITAVDENNPVWCYTFSAYDPEAQTPVFEDASILPQTAGENTNIVYNNVIMPFRAPKNIQEETGKVIFYLNYNVFYNSCCNNTIYEDSMGNTFGNHSNHNIIKEQSTYNMFGIGNMLNILQYGSSANVIGESCDLNDIQGAENVLTGYCQSNTLNGNANTFEDSCSDNTVNGNDNQFSRLSTRNTLGAGCYNNTFTGECLSNTIGDECSFIELSSAKNIHVLSKIEGTEGSPISVASTGNLNYVTYVGKNSNGVLKTWVPADLVP